MTGRDRISLNQLLALCSMLALTPALRLLPGASARLGGRGAWLAVLAALPGAAAYGLFLWRFSFRRLPDESLPALWQRALGRRLGAMALALFALWLLFYAGFTLRAGSERLVTTVFPHARRRFLALPLGLIAAVAGAGEVRRLARMAKLLLPLLLGTIVLTLLFSLPSLRADNLLPISGSDLPDVLRGTLPTLDVAALVLTLLYFLSDRLRAPGRYRSVALRIALLGALMALLVAATVGVFGHELTASLARPYFSLVRALVFFHSLERIEALVVALWLFADFLLLGVLLIVARRCLEALTGPSAWLAPVCGLLPSALAALLAPTAEAFSQLSLQLVPAVNLGVCLGLLPAVYAVGRLRKTL